MRQYKRTYRHWWKKPQNIVDLPDERNVTFLELFYDLAYVAIVAQVGHGLVGDITLVSALQFALLFAMMFWARLNGTLYHELHGNNDLRSRIFTFFQMICLVGMGTFAHGAFGGMYQWFAGSYALFLTVVAYLWWRTGVYDPGHKPLSTPYVAGFSITIILFVVSIFVDPGTAYYLWGIGVLISFLLPTVLPSLRMVNKIDEKQLKAAQKVRPSLIERFGLLTIIMLGEVIVAVVSGGAAMHHMDREIVLVLLGYTCLALTMRWIYFDTISHRIPKAGNAKRTVWMLTHLPLTMCIVLVGIGVSTQLNDIHTLAIVGTQVIVGALLGFLVSILILTSVVDGNKNQSVFTAAVIRGCRVSLFAIIVVFLLCHDTGSFLLWLNIALLIPILFGFNTYVTDIIREFE